MVYYKMANAETQFAIMSAVGPTFRLLDPETSHVLGIEAAKWGLFPKETRPDDPRLRTQLWGRSLTNPIGAQIGRGGRGGRRYLICGPWCIGRMTSFL
jgi:hypothetical protein